MSCTHGLPSCWKFLWNYYKYFFPNPWGKRCFFKKIILKSGPVPLIWEKASRSLSPMPEVSTLHHQNPFKQDNCKYLSSKVFFKYYFLWAFLLYFSFEQAFCEPQSDAQLQVPPLHPLAEWRAGVWILCGTLIWNHKCPCDKKLNKILNLCDTKKRIRSWVLLLFF